MRGRHFFVGVGVLTVVATLGLWLGARAPGEPQSITELPLHLDDRAFWEMVEGFSESSRLFVSSGATRSDNLISNERGFQDVLPDLEKISPPGAYLGVGPEQNFTYITALEPTIAFIIDIRRDNMLLHLMYKALVEMSADRIEFLSHLFARPSPKELGRDASPERLFTSFRGVARSADLAKVNSDAILDRLEITHGFRLSARDEASIRRTYDEFSRGGPDLHWDVTGASWIPSYAELMAATDRHGVNHSYLSSESTFQRLKSYETDGRIVPLVGDFGGDRAIRAVGHYLKEHDATLGAFYTSNVEQYLFASGTWKSFYSNVSTLPINERSIFIRTVFNSIGFGLTGPEYRTSTSLDPMRELLADFTKGHIRGYQSILSR